MHDARFFIAALICFVAAIDLARADGIDPSLKQAILTGWAELEKFDDARPAVDMSIERQTFDGPHKDKGNTQSKARFRRSGDSTLLASEAQGGNEMIRNSRYIAMLSRETQSLPWTMRFVELDLASDNAKALQESAHNAELVAPSSSLQLGSIRSMKKNASAVIADPKFRMTGAERLPDGFVRLHYQYEDFSGEFDCDPLAHYVIRKGRSRYKGPTVEYVMTHERSFLEVAKGPPVVERLSIEVTGRPMALGGHFKQISTYSYPDVRKTGELDEEKFRLTAYGLPEPEGIVWEKPRRWLPYWLARAGLMVILLTTWFLRKARRTRAEVKRP